jgi:hypothetical protein
MTLNPATALVLGSALNLHVRDPLPAMNSLARAAFPQVRPSVEISAVAVLIVNGITRPEMSDTGRTVPVMTEPPFRYDITITEDRDGSRLPDPAEFAVAAERAASARAASVVNAHTAGKVISVVTVHAVDQPAAVAVALAVVAEALKCLAVSSTR